MERGRDMAKIDFWYDFASTYSYLAAMRIEPLAKAAGIELAWRPFLLGPIFKSQGWESSPFNLYPVKGRYSWRDLERLTVRQGLPRFTPPVPFPANSLLAARVALALSDRDRPAFTRAVFNAEFAEGRDISDQCSPGPAIRRSRTSFAPRLRKPRSGASSARRASTPRTASCFGAMTGSSRRSNGRADIALKFRAW
jgi:hypothetical protein